MSNARHYQRKPLEVAAVQWAGDNTEEMIDFLGAHFDLDEDEACVLTTRHSAWRALDPDEWVLLGPGGEIWVMYDDEFAETYTAVADV